MENASVTIYSNPSGFDEATGYRTEDSTPTFIVRNGRCTFAPERSSRRRIGEGGVQELAETIPSLLIEVDEEFAMGMLADVTPDGGTLKRYQITRAVFDSGLCGSEWILELKALDTP